MADRILPSKLVDERITVRFEFLDELAWGETIDSAAFSVQVLSGVDPSPELMLSGGEILTETTAAHRIFAGTPGVIYLVVARATGSTGNVYQKSAKLAVLPSDAQTPLIVATFYSSRLYPIVVEEGIDETAEATEGREYQAFIEGIRESVSLESGNIRDIVIVYEMLPEGIDSSIEIESGDLFAALISYEMLPEGVDSTVSLLTGALENEYVYTIMLPEGVDSSVSIVSGTLV